MKRTLLLVRALLACNRSTTAPSAPPGTTAATLTVTSTSFSANGPIPALYSCDGKDQVPSLTWTAAPDQAKAFALIVDDPDAPGGTFTHLLLWGVSRDVHAIAEAADLSSVGSLGTNDFGKVGWGGPCPPKGSTHHYRFHVYALDAIVEIKDGAKRGDVDNALNGHVIAEGVLVGTFGR